MSPIGPYADFDECLRANADKGSPEGYCAALEKKITGHWPGQMVGKIPESFLNAYDAALVAGKPDAEAFKIAQEAAEADGWEMNRFGWLRNFQSPSMKKVANVDIFAAGTWTDSAGFTREWTKDDLDSMVKAFDAGVVPLVPAKAGHTSDEFNRKIAEALGVPVDLVTGDHGQGQIALGKVTSLQRRGDTLVASFDNVPEAIANLIEGGLYSTVSVEIEDAIGEYGPVVTGVALLGAEEPAVDKATLEKALVFGGIRKGARVLSFQVGDDLPDSSTLRKEFEDIRNKVADVIKGKRGAPLFRALFGNISELFERMVAGRHSSGTGDDEIPEEVRAYADQDFQGNIPALISWAGRVGFDQCVADLTGKPDVTDPVKVCGWLKGRAHTKPNEGGKAMKKLPKILESMKPEEIRALKLPELVKKFTEGEVPTVDELQAAFQDMGPIAAALGLGAEATVEDIVAAIEALMEKANAGGAETPPVEGEMAKEFAKASDRIAVLEGEKRVRDWEDRTREFKAIPGTPHDLAVQLADIESKAGKEHAETQYNALKEANRLSADATRVLGTNRKGEPNDFDNEVLKYRKEHPDADRPTALKAVAREKPDLYLARRQ